MHRSTAVSPLLNTIKTLDSSIFVLSNLLAEDFNSIFCCFLIYQSYTKNKLTVTVQACLFPPPIFSSCKLLKAFISSLPFCEPHFSHSVFKPPPPYLFKSSQTPQQTNTQSNENCKKPTHTKRAHNLQKTKPSSCSSLTP